MYPHGEQTLLMWPPVWLHEMHPVPCSAIPANPSLKRLQIGLNDLLVALLFIQLACNILESHAG